MDTAQPSTNAVSASNLFRLAVLLRDDSYAAMARETLAAFEVEMLQYPWLFVGLLAGVVGARLGVNSRVSIGDGDAKWRSTPRAEPRGVILLAGTETPETSWLLKRNEPLAKLVAQHPGHGIYEWRDGGYVAVDIPSTTN
jgi:uncharacterized protein YyaL (SSP411 family)